MDNQSQSDDKIPEGINLSHEDIEILDRLFDTAPPLELRDNLLEIYHTYLIHVHNTLPLNFDKLSLNMYHLIQSLGTLGDARK